METNIKKIEKKIEKFKNKYSSLVSEIKRYGIKV